MTIARTCRISASTADVGAEVAIAEPIAPSIVAVVKSSLSNDDSNLSIVAVIFSRFIDFIAASKFYDEHYHLRYYYIVLSVVLLKINTRMFFSYSRTLK